VNTFSRGALITLSDLLTLLVTFLVVERSQVQASQGKASLEQYFYSEEDLLHLKSVNKLTLESSSEISITACGSGPFAWEESFLTTRKVKEILIPTESSPSKISLQILGPNCAPLQQTDHQNVRARVFVKTYGHRGDSSHY
jgi:hypothetical protein